MKDLAYARYMERLCRQRAASGHVHSGKWLGEVERWKDVAHQKGGDRFRDEPSHPGPMTMGPNTIEGDSHRQRDESRQRLQSIIRGG
jgi:hypothetical protein